MSKRNRILYFNLLVLFIVFSRICFLSHNIDQYDTAMFVGSVKTKVLLHAPGYVPFIMFGSLLNRLTIHLPLSFSLANTILFIIAAFTWTYYVNKDNIDKYSIFISLVYIFTPSIWLYSIIGMSDGSQFALSSVILTIMFFNNPKKAKNITHLNLIYFIYGILLGIKTIHIILLPIITLYTYQYLYYKKIIIKSLSLPILFFILSILTWVLPQRFYYDDSLIKNSSISLIKRDLGNYAIFGNYYQNISDIFIKIKDLMSFSPYIGLNKNILITIASYFIIGFSILLKIVSRLSKETTRMNEFLKSNVSKYRRVIYPIYYILAYGLFYLLLFAPRTRYFLSTIPAFYLLIHAFIKIKTNKKYLNYVETISMAALIFSFLRVGYINIYPYHKYIDGRTQAINTIKDKTSIDKNQLIVINQRTPGRLDMKAYLDYYVPQSNYQIFNQENILNRLNEYLDETLIKYEEVVLVDQNLSNYLTENYVEVSKSSIYYSGQILSKSFRIERVIDDPQSNIETIKFEANKNKRYLWEHFNSYKQNPNYIDTFGNKISYKMAVWSDNSINPSIFLHPKSNGSQIRSNPFHNEKHKNLHLKAANISKQGDGVILNVYLNNILSASKDIVAKNDLYELNIPLTRKSYIITIEVLPKSDNAYDWIVVTPYLE